MKCGLTSRKAAITTCAVSVPIAFALIGYGLYVVIFSGAGSILSVLNVFVGLWMLMQTYQLGLMIKNGVEAEHPLFHSLPDNNLEDSRSYSGRF